MGLPAPGGTSVVSWLQKIRDGVVFFENFENDNFLTADGWTTLQGSPANSSNQYLDGIKSWDNTAGNQSLPVAKKPITDTNVDITWLVQGWFYDDATHTAEDGPYLKIKTTANKFLSVGVRNSVSTTKYSVSVYSGAVDQPTAATTVTRTTKWHQLQVYCVSGVNITIAIDGTPVTTFSRTGETVSEIHLCANTVGGSGNSFGFFDGVGYYRSQYLLAYLNGTASANGFMGLLDSSNSNLINSNDSGAGALFDIHAISATQQFPVSVFMEVANPGSSTSLRLRSLLTKVSPGDIYQLGLIDFGRKVGMGEPVPTGLLNRNMTNAGQQEVLNYAYKDAVSFQIQNLEGETWRHQADNWFYYANTGGVFFFLLDSLNEDAFGVVSAAVNVPNSTVTIMPNLSTNPTDAFVVGQEYQVRNASNTLKQSVTLASKTTTTLTFNEQLAFNLSKGDYIYSKFLYPFMELGDDKMNGFKLSDAKYFRYSWNQNMREAIQ